MEPGQLHNSTTSRPASPFFKIATT